MGQCRATKVGYIGGLKATFCSILAKWSKDEYLKGVALSWNPQNEKDMWSAGGRDFQVEEIASANAMKQERAHYGQAIKRRPILSKEEDWHHRRSEARRDTSYL